MRTGNKGAARKAAAKKNLRIRVASKARAAPPPDPSSPPLAPDPTPEQVISVLGQQVAIARNAFFKLAKARAADLIRLGQTFDDAAAYVDAEVKALDEQLATAVPQ